MAQENIDERGAARADLTTAAAGLVPQAEEMIFDPEELLVEREEMRRLDAGGGAEFAPGMLDDFGLVIRHVGIVGRPLRLASFTETGQAERPSYN